MIGLESLEDMADWKDSILERIEQINRSLYDDERVRNTAIAASVASTVTYILYKTDAPEAMMAALGDLPGQILQSSSGVGVEDAAAAAAAAGVVLPGVPPMR